MVGEGEGGGIVRVWMGGGGIEIEMGTRKEVEFDTLC